MYEEFFASIGATFEEIRSMTDEELFEFLRQLQDDAWMEGHDEIYA